MIGSRHHPQTESLLVRLVLLSTAWPCVVCACVYFTPCVVACVYFVCVYNTTLFQRPLDASAFIDTFAIRVRQCIAILACARRNAGFFTLSNLFNRSLLLIQPSIYKRTKKRTSHSAVGDYQYRRVSVCVCMRIDIVCAKFIGAQNSIIKYTTMLCCSVFLPKN